MIDVHSDFTSHFATNPYNNVPKHPTRTVTWLGEADGCNGTHLDAGTDSTALQAKLAENSKEFRLVRQYADGTQLVESKTGIGLTYLKSEQVFKWSGEKKEGSTLQGIIVQIPTGRCCGVKFSTNQTMQDALLHKSITSYDVTLVYEAP